jgi:hypothetical protein
MSFRRDLALATGLLAATLLASAPAVADEQTADADFVKRMFADNTGKLKNYACFARRYDKEHLAQHPLQKVSVMKLLITAEKTDPKEDKVLEYSFRLGVNFRDRRGDFDSSGECGHAPTVRNADTDPPVAAGIDFDCGVDCDGGGISVDLANNDGSVIVKLDRIRIWKGNTPDGDAAGALQGGADDKVFRLDRTGLNECASLANDRKELAAMRHK